MGNFKKYNASFLIETGLIQNEDIFFKTSKHHRTEFQVEAKPFIVIFDTTESINRKKNGLLPIKLNTSDGAFVMVALKGVYVELEDGEISFHPKICIMRSFDDGNSVAKTSESLGFPVKKEFDIISDLFPSFVKKIEKLNRKSEKLNLATKIEYEKTRTFTKKIRRHYPGGLTQDFLVEYVSVIVTGESPKLNGWEFIAKIEPHGEAGNIIGVLPGKTLPEEYRKIKELTCDHCQSPRYRKAVYVLHNEKEGYIQIGRSCLKDFLGHSSPESIADRLEWFKELSDFECDPDDEFLSKYPARYYFIDFLSTAAEFILQEGYKGKNSFNSSPTGSKALSNMTSKDKKISISDRAKEIAREVNEWILEKDNGEPVSDYFHNLIVLSKSESIKSNNVNLAASAIAAWAREKNITLHEKSKITSNYVGNVGDKIEKTLKIEVVSTHESFSRFSDHYNIVKMSDEEGNLYIWITNRDGLKEGHAYSIKGTIKEHKEYKGVKETVLTRCRVGDHYLFCKSCGTKIDYEANQNKRCISTYVRLDSLNINQSECTHDDIFCENCLTKDGFCPDCEKNMSKEEKTKIKEKFNS